MMMSFLYEKRIRFFFLQKQKENTMLYIDKRKERIKLW